MSPTVDQVWFVVEPIDMSVGIDGLTQRLQATLGRFPRADTPVPSPWRV